MKTRWNAPPTRRELTLVLFCVTAFVLSYNIDSSLRLLPPSFSLSSSSSSSSSELERDGRRPSAWRDALEDEIVGTWDWEPGKIAEGIGRLPVGDGQEYQKGMIWNGPDADAAALAQKSLVRTSTRNGSVVWGSNIPLSTVVKHTPGYTVIDNLIISGGTFIIVSDTPSSIPPLTAIGSSLSDPNAAPGGSDWQVLSSALAAQVLLDHGAVMHGVTFISPGEPSAQDAYVLPALWRTFASASSAPPLGPPLRHLRPQTPAFTDPYPDLDVHTEGWEYLPIRKRTYVGSDPRTRKATFGAMGMGELMQDDWKDWVEADVPVVLARAVIVDRAAALRNGGASAWQAVNAPQDWWHPVRETLLVTLGVDDEEKQGGWLSGKAKTIVTYVSAQDGIVGLPQGDELMDSQARPPRVRDSDHKTLVDALRRAGKEHDFELHVLDARAPWKSRIDSIVKSTILLAPHGTAADEFTFIKPSARSAYIELFPRDTFAPDAQALASAIGLGWVGVAGERVFTSGSLPPAQTVSAGDIALDVTAVVKAVVDKLSG